YPINPEKIESLKNSISQTGFWDNILARKSNGKIQIAYGHHRLVVLQGNFKPDYIVDIPIKELDDDTMIRIMANENIEQWETNPKIINETVKVTFNHLKSEYGLVNIRKSQGGSFPAIKKLLIPKTINEDSNNGYRHSVIAKQVSNWLGKNWKEERIYYTLERLKMFEKGELDKEAVESFPLLFRARILSQKPV
ncbi:unnamed protein product, partial [marine sediment metagenome]